jgi:hypothetical protein
MLAKIFVPGRNATQSGRDKNSVWVLEYEPEQPVEAEPLMGWRGSGDTLSQLRLSFASREEAEQYARRNGIPYQVASEPVRAKPRKKSYSDNFRYGRKKGWTH